MRFADPECLRSATLVATVRVQLATVGGNIWTCFVPCLGDQRL